MSKRRAGIIVGSVLAAGLAVGGVTTGVVLSTRPLNVTYYANNGTAEVTTQIKQGDIDSLPTPTREGYNFAGWYLDTGLTKQVTNKTKLKQNSKLYAGWELTDGAVLTTTSVNGEATVQAETSGLKSIGAYAFANSKLTSVTIPNTVTTIGEGAFSNCSNLKRITLGKNLTTINNGAFANCASLTTINFNENLTTIGECSFQNCRNLQRLIIPDSVTEIGLQAFQNCYNLEAVKLPNKLTVIEYSLFGGSGLRFVSIPSSVKRIKEGAFDHCNMIENLVIPNGIERIDDYAFNGMSSYLQLFLPASSIAAFRDIRTLFGGNRISKIYCEFSQNDSISGQSSNCLSELSENVYYNSCALDMYEWRYIRDVICQNYLGEYAFRIGDEKKVKLQNSDTEIIVQIADFNHDFGIRSSHKPVNITWVTKELLPESFNYFMNSEARNAGGFKESEMKDYLNGNIFNLLPEDLKECIQPTRKVSGLGDGYADFQEDAYNLFLLSLTERNYYGSDKKYEIYKEEGTPYALFNDWEQQSNSSYGASLRIKTYANSNRAGAWWLRSTTSDNSKFWNVTNDGLVGGFQEEDECASANARLGICFAFCVYM